MRKWRRKKGGREGDVVERKKIQPARKRRLPGYPCSTPCHTHRPASGPSTGPVLSFPVLSKRTWAASSKERNDFEFLPLTLADYVPLACLHLAFTPPISGIDTRHPQLRRGGSCLGSSFWSFRWQSRFETKAGNSSPRNLHAATSRLLNLLTAHP
jgi:hypothetical protein